MSKPRESDTVIGVTAFKARCLALIEEVARGRRRVVITKRGRPLAAVVPLEEPAELWGALKGTVSVAPGTDLTAPTGEVWDADG